MSSLIAYHGKQAIKDEIIAQLRAHYEADEIKKGVYWQNGKGCAVGCTIHSNDHSEYETRFGIPRILARLEDGIFEGLPNKLAKEWPIKFMSVIKPGVDLSKIWPKFAIFLLIDEKHGVLQYVKTKRQKDVIKKIANFYSENKKISIDEWRKVRNAAVANAAGDVAAIYAIYAAACAGDVATYTDADIRAACAADTANYATAARAADARATAARAANIAAARAIRAADAVTYATAATAARAATYADAVARRKHRIAQSKKLLELLESVN